MSIITFPTTLPVAKMTWGQRRNDVVSRSIFGAQGQELSAPLWEVRIEAAMRNDNAQGPWKALMMQLRGQTNQLSLYDVARQAPIGTMRGTMTLNAAALAGATSLSITAGGGQAGKTLKQGDLLGFGSGATTQVVMVVADATADGSGIIAVTIEPAVRNALLISAAITWDKPPVLFRRNTSKASWDYSETFATGMFLDLIEDPRP